MPKIESRTARREAAITGIEEEHGTFLRMTGQIGPSPLLHENALLRHVVAALEAGATVRDLKPFAEPIKISVDQRGIVIDQT